MQPSTVSTKSKRDAAGALCDKVGGDFPGCAAGRVCKTQQRQVFVTGFEPISQSGHLFHGGQVICQVVCQFRAQVDVDADDPAQGFGRLENSDHFVMFRRHQQQGAGVQNRSLCWSVVDTRLFRFQQRQDPFDGVIAIGNALAVKAVTGLAVFDLHDGERGGQTARRQQGLHAVCSKLRPHAVAKSVGGQRVDKADGCVAAQAQRSGTAQAQCSGAGQVKRAAAHERAQTAVGLRHTVHQGLTQNPDF